MPRRPLLSRSLVLTVGLAATLSLPAAPIWAQQDPGAYLAARVAGSDDNYRQAAAWFTRALMADPSNPALMEGAVVGHIGAGSIDSAVAVARRMQQSGQPSQVALLSLVADQAKRGDFAAILADIDGGRKISLLLDTLSKAWAQAGSGKMSEAIATFDEIAKTKGLEAFGLYHKALALAMVGDLEGADDILSGRAAGEIRLMRRGVIAHAEILSQLEKPQDAIAVLDRNFPGTDDPAIIGIKARLTAGETLDWTAARTATDGMAEVFFTLAAALNGEAQDGYTLLYARLSGWLRPDHTEAVLLAAALLEQQKQYGLAVDAYMLVPPADPAHFAAQIGRSRVLQASGQVDAGIEVLQELARRHPEMLPVHVALGDALRRAERWAEAATAYDEAILRAGDQRPELWSLFYSRAIAHERSKAWPKAEADFLTALRLNPEQPQVLNYLGYSWIDRGERLEEALSMIERAVAKEPQSGYIIDSLAWGLFKLGRYAEALEPMERASVLEPVDPIVTDHLGDVYWAVGRRMEARFQWRRALSFDPDETDAERIRRKLELGLDAVLEAEGGRPLHATVTPGPRTTARN